MLISIKSYLLFTFLEREREREREREFKLNVQLFYRFTTNFCYLDLKSCYMCVLRSVSKLTLVTWILSYRMCVSWSICPITNFGHLDLKLLNVCFTICFVVHVCFMICFEILIRFFTVELLSMRSILILWFKNVIYFMWFFNKY